MKASLLISHLNWNLDEKCIELGDGIVFENMNTSKVKSLYSKICKTTNLHDGEPLAIETVIIFEKEQLDEVFPYWHTPHSSVSVVCNMISICTESPIPDYTLILSNDAFKYEKQSAHEIFTNYELLEIFQVEEISLKIQEVLKLIGRRFINNFIINHEIVSDIKALIKNYTALQASQRISNAFDFYFNAWRSHQMLHTCINLSVVLESLFSPSNNTELTHQISFNATQFIGGSKEERNIIYKCIKKFYSLRSKIVHGAEASYDELAVSTAIMFVLCSEIMKRILMSSEMCDTFSNEKKRDDLIKSWMFG
jgi:hypothetical protein